MSYHYQDNDNDDYDDECLSYANVKHSTHFTLFNLLTLLLSRYYLSPF